MADRQIVMEGIRGDHYHNHEKKNVGVEDESSVGELMGVIETVGSYSGYRKAHRKECLSLVRRLKLLLPLLEEMRELDYSNQALSCLANLNKALASAKKLLKNCSCESKIYLVSSLSLTHLNYLHTWVIIILMLLLFFLVVSVI